MRTTAREWRLRLEVLILLLLVVRQVVAVTLLSWLSISVVAAGISVGVTWAKLDPMTWLTAFMAAIRRRRRARLLELLLLGRLRSRERWVELRSSRCCWWSMGCIRRWLDVRLVVLWMVPSVWVHRLTKASYRSRWEWWLDMCVRLRWMVLRRWWRWWIA